MAALFVCGGASAILARMRIGLDLRLNYYRPGGIVEYARHVLHAVAALDPATTFCPIQHARDPDSLAVTPNIRRIRTLTPSHHPWERWLLPLELARHRLDLYHTPDAIPVLGGARRCVITIHDLHYLHFPQFMTVESRRHYNGQIKWAVHKAHHILVPSESTRRDLAQLLDVDEAKVSVHLLGVDHAHFRPLAPEPLAAARRRLGLPPDYLLFVGTFEPRKNIPGLLRAYHRLRETTPDAPPLVLAGRSGWLADDIYRTAEALQLARHLIWLENLDRDDLPALYGGASLLALLSHYEGFGLTALEAMACGTPPVVSDRSSLPEVVGDAGLLVPPDDSAAAAAAFERVLTQPTLRADLRARGLRRAAEFTWQRAAEIVLQTYRAVLQ